MINLSRLAKVSKYQSGKPLTDTPDLSNIDFEGGSTGQYLVNAAATFNLDTVPVKVDGISLKVGDKVLLPYQNNPVENGVFSCVTGAGAVVSKYGDEFFGKSRLSDIPFPEFNYREMYNWNYGIPRPKVVAKMFGTPDPSGNWFVTDNKLYSMYQTNTPIEVCDIPANSYVCFVGDYIYAHNTVDDTITVHLLQGDSTFDTSIITIGVPSNVVFNKLVGNKLVGIGNDFRIHIMDVTDKENPNFVKSINFDRPHPIAITPRPSENRYHTHLTIDEPTGLHLVQGEKVYLNNSRWTANVDPSDPAYYYDRQFDSPDLSDDFYYVHKISNTEIELYHDAALTQVYKYLYPWDETSGFKEETYTPVNNPSTGFPYVQPPYGGKIIPARCLGAIPDPWSYDSHVIQAQYFYWFVPTSSEIEIGEDLYDSLTTGEYGLLIGDYPPDYTGDRLNPTQNSLWPSENNNDDACFVRKIGKQQSLFSSDTVGVIQLEDETVLEWNMNPIMGNHYFKPYRFEVKGFDTVANNIYVITKNKLHIFDVMVGFLKRTINDVCSSGNVQDLQIYDDYLFVCGNNISNTEFSVSVYDISNADSPEYLFDFEQLPAGNVPGTVNIPYSPNRLGSKSGINYGDLEVVKKDGKSYLLIGTNNDFYYAELENIPSLENYRPIRLYTADRESNIKSIPNKAAYFVSLGYKDGMQRFFDYFMVEFGVTNNEPSLKLNYGVCEKDGGFIVSEKDPVRDKYLLSVFSLKDHSNPTWVNSHELQWTPNFTPQGFKAIHDLGQSIFCLDNGGSAYFMYIAEEKYLFLKEITALGFGVSDKLYCVSSKTPLSVDAYDISDPINVQFVETFSSSLNLPDDLIVKSDVLTFILSGRTLLAVTDKIVGNENNLPPMTYNTIATYGVMAFLGTEEKNLYVINGLNLESSPIVDVITSALHIKKIQVHDKYLIVFGFADVGDVSPKYEIYDISDVENIVLTNTVNSNLTTTAERSIFVKGGFIFCFTEGFEIIDFRPFAVTRDLDYSMEDVVVKHGNTLRNSNWIPTNRNVTIGTDPIEYISVIPEKQTTAKILTVDRFSEEITGDIGDTIFTGDSIYKIQASNVNKGTVEIKDYETESLLLMAPDKIGPVTIDVIDSSDIDIPSIKRLEGINKTDAFGSNEICLWVLSDVGLYEMPLQEIGPYWPSDYTPYIWFRNKNDAAFETISDFALYKDYLILIGTHTPVLPGYPSGYPALKISNEDTDTEIIFKEHTLSFEKIVSVGRNIWLTRKQTGYSLFYYVDISDIEEVTSYIDIDVNYSMYLPLDDTLFDMVEDVVYYYDSTTDSIRIHNVLANVELGTIYKPNVISITIRENVAYIFTTTEILIVENAEQFNSANVKTTAFTGYGTPNSVITVNDKYFYVIFDSSEYFMVAVNHETLEVEAEWYVPNGISPVFNYPYKAVSGILPVFADGKGYTFSCWTHWEYQVDIQFDNKTVGNNTVIINGLAGYGNAIYYLKPPNDLKGFYYPGQAVGTIFSATDDYCVQAASEPYGDPKPRIWGMNINNNHPSPLFSFTENDAFGEIYSVEVSDQYISVCHGKGFSWTTLTNPNVWKHQSLSSMRYGAYDYNKEHSIYDSVSGEMDVIVTEQHNNGVQVFFTPIRAAHHLYNGEEFVGFILFSKFKIGLVLTEGTVVKKIDLTGDDGGDPAVFIDGELFVATINSDRPLKLVYQNKLLFVPESDYRSGVLIGSLDLDVFQVSGLNPPVTDLAEIADIMLCGSDLSFTGDIPFSTYTLKDGLLVRTFQDLNNINTHTNNTVMVNNQIIDLNTLYKGPFLSDLNVLAIREPEKNLLFTGVSSIDIGNSLAVGVSDGDRYWSFSNSHLREYKKTNDILYLLSNFEITQIPDLFGVAHTEEGFAIAGLTGTQLWVLDNMGYSYPGTTSKTVVAVMPFDKYVDLLGLNCKILALNNDGTIDFVDYTETKTHTVTSGTPIAMDALQNYIAVGSSSEIKVIDLDGNEKTFMSGDYFRLFNDGTMKLLVSGSNYSIIYEVESGSIIKTFGFGISVWEYGELILSITGATLRIFNPLFEVENEMVLPEVINAQQITPDVLGNAVVLANNQAKVLTFGKILKDFEQVLLVDNSEVWHRDFVLTDNRKLLPEPIEGVIKKDGQSFYWSSNKAYLQPINKVFNIIVEKALFADDFVVAYNSYYGFYRLSTEEYNMMVPKTTKDWVVKNNLLYQLYFYGSYVIRITDIKEDIEIANISLDLDLNRLSFMAVYEDTLYLFVETDNSVILHKFRCAETAVTKQETIEWGIVEPKLVFNNNMLAMLDSKGLYLVDFSVSNEILLYKEGMFSQVFLQDQIYLLEDNLTKNQVERLIDSELVTFVRRGEYKYLRVNKGDNSGSYIWTNKWETL